MTTSRATLAMITDIRATIAEGATAVPVTQRVADALGRHPDASPVLRAQLEAALTPTPDQMMNRGAAMRVARMLRLG